jgi:hypothetical protein
VWKWILGLVAAIVVIGALGREAPEQQTYIGKSGKPVVSQDQFTGGTRDGWGDRLTRDMKQINKNYNDCVADIRSGVSGVRNQSIACDRNAGRR